MTDKDTLISELQNQQGTFSQSLLNSSFCGIAATDLDGNIIYVNDRARELLGITRDLTSEPMHISEIDPVRWIDFKKVITNRKPQIGIPILKGIKPLIANRTPLVWKGELVGVISIIQDMEEFEDISQRLFEFQELNRQVEAIIDSSYDGIYVTDGDANTIKVNKSYEIITGIHAAEVLGRNMRDLVRDGYYSESVTLKVLEKKDVVTLTQKLKTGKEILVTGNPIFNEFGKIIMVVTNVRDMTDLVNLNRRLEQSLEMTLAYKDRLQQIQSRGSDFIIASKGMQSVFELVQRVSDTDATILIHGETGVGKERVAEEIHNQSSRGKEGILVKLNCGALPESLLESELFGYESGAFTGARKEGKMGLFEVADKGTIFLDEVESMSLALQSKLLRVLQSFEITRVGGTKPRKVDVRVVCATNQELKELIREQRFREDLYYRLNVIPIYIPPLRERSDDIPLLIEMYLNRFNKKHARNKNISRDALQGMRTYSWPGNVRELVNLIERLVVVTHGDIISLHHLPPEFHTSAGMDELCLGCSLKEYLRNIELTIIQDAINRYGNARKAAPHLGMDASSITRKLK
ncbi:MAG TPA: sigma 54-interacting transcriptional regulator [Deltaproteobacteria bacterium]|nr:sigma 54-interacting transcriptional regulator [Deltaproteobacteria bacterium]